MASAPGIILMATAVSFGNEWIQDPLEPNFRVVAAGGLFSLFIAGVADLNEQAAKGIAVMAFITVMLTPFKGNSPLGTLAGLAIAKPAAPGAGGSGNTGAPISSSQLRQSHGG